MARELDPLIKGQITDILNDATWPEAFDQNTLKEVERFEICTKVIDRAVNAIKQIPEFNRSVSDNYFTENFGKKIPFNIGMNRFEVSYYKRHTESDNTSSEEDLVIIRNGEEKANIHKYIFPSGKVNGHISYSESAPDFRTAKHYGNEKAVEECERLIKELELGSK